MATSASSRSIISGVFYSIVGDSQREAHGGKIGFMPIGSSMELCLALRWVGRRRSPLLRLYVDAGDALAFLEDRNSRGSHNYLLEVCEYGVEDNASVVGRINSPDGRMASLVKFMGSIHELLQQVVDASRRAGVTPTMRG